MAKDENEDSAPKKGKSLFGSIGSMLFQEEEPSAANQKAPPEILPPHPKSRPGLPPTVAPGTYAATPVAAVPANSVVDTRIRAVLEKAVHEAALPAYAAFNQMMSGLQTVIPDEVSRIKAALASIVTQNKAHDLAAVLKDIEECLTALETKEREGTARAETEIKSRVGGRESRVSQFSAQIAAKEQQIQALDAEIIALSTQREQEQRSISADRVEIESTQRSFTATVAAFRADLQRMKQSVTTYGRS